MARIPLDKLEIMTPKELGRILLDEAVIYPVDIGYIDDLINAGASLNVRDIGGNTPLHLVAYYSNLKVIKLLIAAGAYLDARNKLDYTPLHFAARTGHVEVVKALLEAGTSKEILDNEDETPWALASFTIQDIVPQLNPDYNE